MSPPSELLERLFQEVQQSVSCSSRLVITDVGRDFMTIQVGRSDKASVSICVLDAAIPTYSVTFPKLHSDRKGSNKIIEDTATGTLSAGVVWIIRKVFRFGFVPPEGYRKDHRSNTAKAEQAGRGDGDKPSN